MNLFLNDSDMLYNALLQSDRSYDGLVFVCVKTTGIFCRLSCNSRKPKRENVFFSDSPAGCLEQGFRPCKKCDPLHYLRTPRHPIFDELMEKLRCEPEFLWSEENLRRMNYDPSTVRRVFKQKIGMTFLDLARLKRAGVAAARLLAGARVIEAQLDAGYQSSSGFRETIHRMIGSPPQSLKDRNLLKASWLETPIGQMLAIADEQALHLLEFFDRKGLPNELAKLQQKTQSVINFGRNQIIDLIESELTDYFAAKSFRFTTPVAVYGSPFTVLVWQELMKIRPGSTLSYAALAQLVERPQAMRAVARANTHNQLAIIIPCHRVIGSDGSLTGYSGGLWRKDWLLRHEKRGFDANVSC